MKVDIIRGRLTDDEKEKIAKLVETKVCVSAYGIAQRLNRRTGTIKWYMLTHGLINRAPSRAPRIYQRKQRYGSAEAVLETVYPWAKEHDDLILRLRAEGLSTPKVAQRLTGEFNIKRNGHSVRVRLALLAAAPD